MTEAQMESLSKLTTLPYLQGYHAPKEKKGVTIYDKARAYEGLNLFCSGHAPKVYLMTMDGKILHEWGIQFEEVWPNPLPFFASEEHKEFIRKAYLYSNGDLLAIFAYIGLIKLDKDSNLLWSHLGQNHHDIDIAKNGYIFTLGAEDHTLLEMRQKYPQIRLDGLIRDDYISVLTPTGDEIRRISVFHAFYDSDYASYLDFTEKKGDIFHTNTIDIIPESAAQRYPMFEAGDMLISLRNINTIAVIDSEKGTVKWALSGMWRHQHQSVLLDNGNILLLDNQGGNRHFFFKFDRSRVIEINPFTQEIVWQYGEGMKTIFSLPMS